MNWEWILSVIGIVLFCVAFYAYLSEPVGKAVKEAEDDGYIMIGGRKYYEDPPASTTFRVPEPIYPYEGFPQEPDPVTGVAYGFTTDLNAIFPVSVTIGDAPKLPKKPRKAPSRMAKIKQDEKAYHAKKTVKKAVKKTAKKKSKPAK